MTTKADYTEEEWHTLVQAPMLAGMYIIMADLSMTAMPKEMAGMLKGMSTPEVAAAAQDVVAAIVADYTAKTQNKEKLAQPEIDKTQDPKKQLLALLLTATAMLNKKASAAEKAGFNEWLLLVANATAEAGREGGFLGIGSVRVSDKEKAALEELKSALE
jgi:hypothetical protein